MKLTKTQIERQDFVDNKVNELIQSLLPEGGIFNWNIELIGNIRDLIEHEVVDYKRMLTSTQLYP